MTTTDPRGAPGSHRPDWLPAHQSSPQPSHQRSHQPSHQAPPQPPEPTHRIVTPAPHQQSPQPSHQASHQPSHQASHQASHHLSHQPDHTTPESEWDDEPLGFRDRLADAFAELRFVRETPGSLQDQMAYAKQGAYATRNGLWRRANILFVRFIGNPGTAVLYLLKWAFFSRLSRTITSLVVAVPLLAVLNGVPVVELVIPDWADITSWMQGG